jgi:carbamoyltransferase
MMNKVIKLLQQGEVIALFQGRSEAGARALGNRSLIFNPTIEGMNDYVNEIKGREKYRPVAATVLSQQVYDWFDTDRLANSPYMSFAFGVRDNKRKLIPAVVHVDGTCRVQTVTEEQNKNYYNLIDEFYKVSGVPLVGNTSLNLAGEPLVEKLDQALDILQRSKIKYLYLPEKRKLITN